MGSFLSFPGVSAKPIQKRKRERNYSLENISPTKKRIRSTYEYVYQALFCKGEGSDITVTALGRDWALHRVYIKNSPFFAAMLCGGWRETDCSHIDLKLSDENITRQALHVVFGSLYRDWIPLTGQTVLNILAAATWFHLEDVRHQCSDYLRRGIRLETLIEFHGISEKYNLPELHQTCVNWLSQKLLVLPHAPSLFSLLKQIPISLMEPVVNHPKLVVLQLEQDVFICLLKWLYLQHNPDKEYCNASQLLKDAYDYFKYKKPAFLESPEGKDYLLTFGGVRWAHVISLYKVTRRIIEDNIIPQAWLREAFQRQWMQMISSHESQCAAQSATPSLPSTSSGPFTVNLPPRFNSTDGAAVTLSISSPRQSSREPPIPGPVADLPDAEFWHRSERFGRRMRDPEQTSNWRWSGFHFGVDVLIKYRRRIFHVIRLTDANIVEGAVSRAKEHRLKICLTILSCPEEDGDDAPPLPHPASPASITTAASTSTAPPSSVTDSADIVTDFSDFEADIEAEDQPEAATCQDWGEDWETSSSPSESSQVCCSGLKTFIMGENMAFELLRLPDNFIFPAVVSANILRYDPIPDASPGVYLTEPNT